MAVRRNARASTTARIHKDRIVEDFALNEVEPLAQRRIGFGLIAGSG